MEKLNCPPHLAPTLLTGQENTSKTMMDPNNKRDNFFNNVYIFFLFFYEKIAQLITLFCLC